MIDNAIIVFGSSRSDGHTREAIDLVLNKLSVPIPVIDLADKKVAEFSYKYNQCDDFHDLIKEVLNYELIVLATPVYWYSVSAKMKCFLDRLSDLLAINKELGRRLRGKKLAVIASYYTYPEGINGFEEPIKNTAAYLGMSYLGAYFHYSGDEIEGINKSLNSLNQFLDSVLTYGNKSLEKNEQNEKNELLTLMNVGVATYKDFKLLGIQSISALAQASADELYIRLQEIAGRSHDPCVWDIFAAAINEAQTGEKQPWWEWTKVRKKRQAEGTFCI